MYWCIMFYGRISNVSGGICPLMSEKLAHWSVPVRAEAGSALSQQEDGVGFHLIYNENEIYCLLF